MEDDSFIEDFSVRLGQLHELLSELLKEEDLLKNHALIKHGFLLHRYTLKFDGITRERLTQLIKELEQVRTIENDIQHRSKAAHQTIVELETDYDAYYEARPSLKLERHLKASLHDAAHLSQLSIVRCNELLDIATGKVRLSFDKRGGRLLQSLERMLNQVMKLVVTVRQLDELVRHFSHESYYPSPRCYGRAMGRHEFKKTKSSHTLAAEKNPVPVFDAPDHVREKVLSFSSEQRRDMFSKIGVTGPSNVVFFETRLKPLNADNPVQQKNGLREYKFPRGIAVDVTAAA